jgi:hypothetical protein
MRVGEIGNVQRTIYNMVYEFINEHQIAWDNYREEKRKESIEEHLKIYPDATDFKGIMPGRSLSYQSFIGTDLLIDFWYLASKMESSVPFVHEYWIRSNGVQCIKESGDAEHNRKVWSDIIGKFVVEFDGEVVTRIEWVQDDDCLIKNRLIK